MNDVEVEIKTKVLNNDEAGLRALFDLYYKPLCLYSIKFIDDFSKAEDVVQEVFIKFWELHRNKSLEGSIRNYLFKAVKNNSLSFLRKQNRYQCQLIDEYDNIPDWIDEEPIDIDCKKRKLYKEIDKLSPQAKVVFERIVFGNQKYKEVADELNISVNTVKTTYARSLKRLRNSLDVIILIILP